MSTTKISALGLFKRDLELHQGATLFPVRHQVDNEDGNPRDLTGWQVRGQIRRKALADDVVVTFQTRIAPDPTAGWYEWWLSDEQTASIPCGDTLTDPASVYEYDIELEDPDGNVRVMFYGTCRVRPGVTR